MTIGGSERLRHTPGKYREPCTFVGMPRTESIYMQGMTGLITLPPADLNSPHKWEVKANEERETAYLSIEDVPQYAHAPTQQRLEGWVFLVT